MKTKDQKFKDHIVKRWCSDWTNNYDNLLSVSYISLIYNEIIAKFKLTIDYIEKNQDKINWEALSRNEFIDWDTNFILKHKEKFDWHCLSLNKGIQHTTEIHEIFKNEWNFLGLIESKKVLANKLFILLNKDYIGKSINYLYQFSHYEDLIDPEIMFDIEILDTYKDVIDWKTISSKSSLFSSIDLLRKFQNLIDWQVLSQNLHIKDEELLIEILFEFKDKLSWVILKERPCCLQSPKVQETFSEQLNNEKAAYKIISDDLRKELDLLDGIEPTVIDQRKFYPNGRFTNAEIDRMLSNKELFWDLELLSSVLMTFTQDIAQFDWNKFSTFHNVNWNAKILEKYKTNLNWKYLSRNKSIPWDLTLLEKFVQNIDWDEMILNSKINWNLEYLKKFKLHLGLENEYSSIYKSFLINWNNEILSTLKKDLNWNGLIKSSNIIWTSDLIYSNKSHWFKAFSDSDFDSHNGPNVFWDLYILSKVNHWDKFIEANWFGWDFFDEEKIRKISWLDCIVPYLNITDIEKIYGWCMSLQQRQEAELKKDNYEDNDEDSDIKECFIKR